MFVFVIVVFFIRDLQNLAVNRDASADDPQHRKNGYENTLCPDPFIYVETDKKTKQNAPGHGQTDLHHDGKIFCPDPMFVIFKAHVPETDFSP